MRTWKERKTIGGKIKTKNEMEESMSELIAIKAKF
jgi:hypothetical protein